MKKFFYAIAACLFFGVAASAQTSEISIIPQPKSLKRLDGEFKFTRQTKLVATGEAGRRSAGILNDLLMKHHGFKLEYVEKMPKSNFILIETQPAVEFDPGGGFSQSMKRRFPQNQEAYLLAVFGNHIKLSANNETGLFYSLQTFLQLIPADFKGETKIPVVLIEDEPRFKYRGMHLDVSRHFFPLDFVKKYIDLLAQYKFNQFHWHLTDDQGWRIEIKKYPKLTEIGSKRKESQAGRYTTTFRGDNVPVEGFYTQEQIREVVAYAKARRINVIPEIELPGHASAALAAYPQLGCKENFDYKVQRTWGIFKEVFCPTDATFKFLEDVLEETIALFPDSPYIHIGGDEVLKDHWKESAFVQDLMKRENLKDEHEVQSYFIRRIEKFVNSKGKRIIGWDEILEGGLAPNATVMSWRGERGGIQAAKAKHDVIMTPAGSLYFDYGQGDPNYEPLNIGNHLPLEAVYNYNPVPKELTPDEAKYILGAQANLWTEYIKTPENVEYMVFPRLLALAEVVWSPHESKNFADFRRRLPDHFARLDKQSVNYRIPEPDGLENRILKTGTKTVFELKSAVTNAKIFYTLDGSEPGEKSILYEKPVVIDLPPNERVELKTVVVTENGRKSVPYSATIVRREPLKAVEPTAKKPGVNLKFYKGKFKGLEEFANLPPVEERESKSIQLPQLAGRTNNLEDAFGAAFGGFIYAPEEAIYEFQIEANDGAQLAIGGETVIEINEAGDKLTTRYGIVPLQKGYHKIDLRYFQTGGEAVLNLRWGIKGTGLRRIYGNELFY